MKPNKPYKDNLIESLRDSEEAALYLEESLSAGDMDAFKIALRNVAEAQLGGISELSKATDLNREALYRTLSKRGNPQLDTLSKVLSAFGLRVAVSIDSSQPHLRP